MLFTKVAAVFLIFGSNVLSSSVRTSSIYSQNQMRTKSESAQPKTHDIYILSQSGAQSKLSKSTRILQRTKIIQDATKNNADSEKNSKKTDQSNNKKNADTNKNIGKKNNEKENATKNSGNSEKNSKISDKKDTEKNKGKGNNNKNSDKSNATTKNADREKNNEDKDIDKANDEKSTDTNENVRKENNKKSIDKSNANKNEADTEKHNKDINKINDKESKDANKKIGKENKNNNSDTNNGNSKKNNSINYDEENINKTFISANKQIEKNNYSKMEIFKKLVNKNKQMEKNKTKENNKEGEADRGSDNIQESKIQGIVSSPTIPLTSFQSSSLKPSIPISHKHGATFETPSLFPSVFPSKETKKHLVNISVHLSMHIKTTSLSESNAPSTDSTNVPSATIAHYPLAQRDDFQETNSLQNLITNSSLVTPMSSPLNEPTKSPQVEPMISPLVEQAISQSAEPTNFLLSKPLNSPSAEPTNSPSAEPINSPFAEPTNSPSAEPINLQSLEPTNFPSAKPTNFPSAEPTNFPPSEPNNTPSIKFINNISTRPSNAGFIKDSKSSSVDPTESPSIQLKNSLSYQFVKLTDLPTHMNNLQPVEGITPRHTLSPSLSHPNDVSEPKNEEQLGKEKPMWIELSHPNLNKTIENIRDHSTSYPTITPTIFQTLHTRQNEEQATSHPSHLHLSPFLSNSLSLQPSIPLSQSNVEEKVIALPSFTMLLVLLSSDADEEDLVRVTSSHMNKVFSRDPSFLRVKLSAQKIEKRGRHLSYIESLTPKNHAFKFSGSAAFNIGLKVAELDMEKMIEMAFSKQYLTNFITLSTRSDIHVISVNVEVYPTFQSDLETNEDKESKNKNDFVLKEIVEMRRGMTTLLSVFFVCTIAAMTVSVMMYRRRNEIDHNFVEKNAFNDGGKLAYDRRIFCGKNEDNVMDVVDFLHITSIGSPISSLGGSFDDNSTFKPTTSIDLKSLPDSSMDVSSMSSESESWENFAIA